jgi:pyruvate dehydrogenase E1 component beta subunit
MPQMNLVQAINDALKTEMRRDPTVLVLGEDVGVNGGVFRVTESLYKEFGPDRSIDTPLSEAGIVGTAIGLALNGLKPVAEIQFDGFLAPAFDQIVSHAARIRWRSRGRFHVPIVIRAPYGGGIRGPELHSESPEAYYAHTPGLKVVIPSNPYDAKGLLIAAIRDPDPVIYLEPKRLYRAFRAEVPEGDYIVPIGKARLAREGAHVTVICWGAMVPVALGQQRG